MTELQARNTELEIMARNAVEHADQRLRTAALNVHRLDWVWAHRIGGSPELIGSKFWISLRDALRAGPMDKWSRAQQFAAIDLIESTSPTARRSTGSGVRLGP